MAKDMTMGEAREAARACERAGLELDLAFKVVPTGSAIGEEVLLVLAAARSLQARLEKVHDVLELASEGG